MHLSCVLCMPISAFVLSTKVSLCKERSQGFTVIVLSPLRRLNCSKLELVVHAIECNRISLLIPCLLSRPVLAMYVRVCIALSACASYLVCGNQLCDLLQTVSGMILRGSTWSNDELLSIWGEKKVQNELDRAKRKSMKNGSNTARKRLQQR